MKKKRCSWATNDPIYIQYHDREWGVPLCNERLLFEFLSLEGMQAGLSWITILKRRKNYRAAFDNFDPAKIARYDSDKMRELLKNEGIIRNKLKIQSIIINSNAFIELKKHHTSFSDYVWDFVEKTPILKPSEKTNEKLISEKLSQDLKRHGFKFVGNTICYFFMQAIGMVNDHDINCFRRREIVSQFS